MKKSKDLKIAIIGCERSWGNFCFQHLSGYGRYELLLRDKGSGTSLAFIAEHADIIIVAVPLPIMVRTIQKLGKLRPNQLIIDFASRKADTMKVMLESGAEVLGLHPLESAPEKKKKLRGCTIVACAGKVVIYEKWIERFLSRIKAKIVWRTSDEHDAVMLVQQNAVFQLLLVHAIVLEKMKVLPGDVVAMRTKLSRKPLAAMARMLLNSTPIYADILQCEGEDVESVMRMLEQAAEEVRALITRDKKYLLECMTGLRQYFGDKALRKLVEGEF